MARTARRANREQELAQSYLFWLEPQFRTLQDNPGKTYWDLINLMFEKDFVVIIPKDVNRVVDGTDLRVEFAHQNRIPPERMGFLGEGSFFEVLIALSRKMAFVAGGRAPGWSWHLITNLELDRMWDRMSEAKKRKADEVIDNCMWRKYLPDGTGGFFPLAWPEDDMTQIELWYQLNAYASELHPEH